MKKLLLLCLSLAFVFCFATVHGEDDLLARIQARGYIVVAMEGTWAPWTYHDENDELVGLDVDIAKLIAEGLGVEARFEEPLWDAILSGVDSGRYDIACNGVGYTEERAKSYLFTTPYVYTQKVLVVRADNDEIKTVEDLKGKKTANTSSSTYAALAESYGATVEPVDNLADTILQVLQGRVDATINARVSIEDYLKQNPDANIKVVQVLSGDPVAYPLSMSEKVNAASLVEAINAILAQAREDGRLAAISVKYFGVDLTVPE